LELKTGPIDGIHMTLEDLGNIGEFLGALGVIASLVYLAVQIRQNTRSIRASAFQDAQRDVAGMVDGLAHDPELTRIFYDGNRDFESFSSEDRRRYAVFMSSMIRRYENLLHQTRIGNIDPTLLEGLFSELRRVFSLPGVRAWWAGSQDVFNRELRDFIEKEIIGPDASMSAAQPAVEPDAE